MARALDAIRRSGKMDGTTAVPTGYARAPTYKNPPGAVPLKILHAMIDHAGSDIQDDSVWHEMLLRDAIQKTSIHHISAEQADQYLDELEALRLSFWRYDVQTKSTVIERGVVVQHAKVHLPDGNKAQATIRLRFGSIFCELARTSDFYTLLQNNVIWALRSRYAIALYQHISALSGQRYPKVIYTIDELRNVLGVIEGRLRTYKDLHSRAIKPAVDQVNSCPTVPWRVSYKAMRRGRAIHKVVLEWKPKEVNAQEAFPFDLDAADDAKAVAQRSLEASPRTNGVRQLGRQPDTFPEEGSIAATRWEAIATEHAKPYDADRVANDYRTWCENAGIPLDKRGGAQRFTTFCAGYAENQSKSGAKKRNGAGPTFREIRENDAPFGRFPESGNIQGTEFEALAAEHAPGEDPDSIGRDYADRLRRIGLRFVPPHGITHEDDFVKFCRQTPDPGNGRRS